MAIPGDAYLQHSGAKREWPIDDEGRYLPLERQQDHNRLIAEPSADQENPQENE